MTRFLPPHLGLSEEPPLLPELGVADLPLPDLPEPPSPAPAPLRLFSTWEICRYILPMAPGHLRRVLRETPTLPQGRDPGEEEGGARWFTLEEVFALRAHFLALGPRGQRFAPPRPAGPPAHVLAVAQLGRGMGRTVTLHHLAALAAMDGYRVLVLDLDPGGDLTRHLAAEEKPEAPGVLPLFSRHAGARLRLENRRRIDRGEAPVPMEAEMDRAMERSLADELRASRWPGVDLLGAGAALHRLAWQVPLWQAGIPGWQPWAALRDRLQSEGVLARYDLILIDTGPDMGPLTQAAVAAADSLLVPLRADPAGRGLRMAQATLAQVAALFGEIEARETRTARALGRTAERFVWADQRLVLTRCDESRQAAEVARLQAALGERLMPQRQAESDLIGSGPGQVACLYEADYRDSSRARFEAARASFDAVYAAVKAQVLASWRARAAARG